MTPPNSDWLPNVLMMVYYAGKQSAMPEGVKIKTLTMSVKDAHVAIQTRLDQVVKEARKAVYDDGYKHGHTIGYEEGHISFEPDFSIPTEQLNKEKKS